MLLKALGIVATPKAATGLSESEGSGWSDSAMAKSPTFTKWRERPKKEQKWRQEFKREELPTEVFMKKSLFLLLISIFITSSACALNTANANANKGETSDMKIGIQITSDSGSHKLTATLVDNSSATAFYNLLKKAPVTIKMSDYSNFEKYGPIGTSLPRNDTQITTTAGDIILYQGNQIAVYYDTNSWNFTRLGKVDGVTQAELKKILGKGNVTAVFSVME